MTRADDLAAKAARLRARQAPTGQAPTPDPAATSVPQYVSSSVPPVRSRPVRLTVDVSPADHAALLRLTVEAAAQLGLTRVHGQEIVRALIARMLTDADLQARVLADVAQVRRAH